MRPDELEVTEESEPHLRLWASRDVSVVYDSSFFNSIGFNPDFFILAISLGPVMIKKALKPDPVNIIAIFFVKYEDLVDNTRSKGKGSHSCINSRDRVTRYCEKTSRDAERTPNESHFTSIFSPSRERYGCNGAVPIS